jgi:hypothetical protein
MSLRGFLFTLVALSAAPGSAQSNTEASKLLGDVLTSELAKEQRLDVIASEDIRRQLDLEGQKQTLGCSEDASCLAEIANALGARLVVYGKLGKLGEIWILTLNLFDSEKTQAAGRVVVRDKTLEGLSGALEGPAHQLVASFVASLPAEAPRARLLVLDLQQATSDEAPRAPPPAGPNLVVIGGVTGGAGLLASIGGAVALVGAAFKDDEADNKLGLTAIEANDAYTARDNLGVIGAVALGVGVPLIVGGAAALVMGMNGDEG